MSSRNVEAEAVRERRGKRGGSGNPSARLARLLKGVVVQIELERHRKGKRSTDRELCVRMRVGDSVYILVRRRTSDLEGLSARQRQVARLVLEGLPRKRIAAKLGVGPKTVDTHVRRLFEKLGVDSKIALATLLGPI